MANEVVLRFDEVTFEYQHKKPLLDEASFSVRDGAKITLMGQNGAGKSTLFKMITGELSPKSGRISVAQGATVGTAKQVVAREDLDLSVEQYLAKVYKEDIPYNAKGKMNEALEAVNLVVPYDRIVGDLSGGQQARLLLAFALMQSPDILLLDEPTNNLDKDGIDHLIQFLIMYDKTVIVISHDADFLNCFTDGVIYLDIFTHKIETYVGDYYSVVEEIGKRIEREQMRNARLEKDIQDRKEKANYFSHKGGNLRKLAQRLKETAAEQEANKVDVKREDKTIKSFMIPAQDVSGEIAFIEALKIIRNHEPVVVPANIELRKRNHLLVSGPNGIGKSTLLRNLVSAKPEGVRILPGVRVGYYSQDFSALNFDHTVFQSLHEAMLDGTDEQTMRATAAGFLLTGELMERKVGDLSEGQKGLLSFARLVLQQPGLIILDEPTNHINFRHIPVIADALDKFEGTMILVSHMPEFVREIRIDEILDLGKLANGREAVA